MPLADGCQADSLVLKQGSEEVNSSVQTHTSASDVTLRQVKLKAENKNVRSPEGAPRSACSPASPLPPSPGPQADTRQVWELSRDPNRRSDGGPWAPKDSHGLWSPSVMGPTLGGRREWGRRHSRLGEGPPPHPSRPRQGEDDSASHRIKVMGKKELSAWTRNLFRWLAFQGGDISVSPTPSGEALSRPSTADPRFTRQETEAQEGKGSALSDPGRGQAGFPAQAGWGALDGKPFGFAAQPLCLEPSHLPGLVGWRLTRSEPQCSGPGNGSDHDS